MGPGDGATEKDKQLAFKLGKLIAQEGWILLSGGRNKGIMDAVSKGAKADNGLTIGILPFKDNNHTSEAVDIAILTGMGSARNIINILSSDVIIACGMGAGTASEIALAIKADKKIILLNAGQEGEKFFKNLAEKNIFTASSSKEAIAIIKRSLDKNP